MLILRELLMKLFLWISLGFKYCLFFAILDHCFSSHLLALDLEIVLLIFVIVFTLIKQKLKSNFIKNLYFLLFSLISLISLLLIFIGQFCFFSGVVSFKLMTTTCSQNFHLLVYPKIELNFAHHLAVSIDFN